jgi:hypothetical protein
VTTPDTTGYNLTVAENHTLQTAGGGSDKEFTNYTTNSPLDYAWSAPSTSAEKFGFALNTGTVKPAQAYKNDGVSACNSAGGTVNGTNCWNGFTGSAQKVVTSSAATASGGDAVNFSLKAQAAGTNFLQPGAYANTVTSTATVGP